MQQEGLEINPTRIHLSDLFETYVLEKNRQDKQLQHKQFPKQLSLFSKFHDLPQWRHKWLLQSATWIIMLDIKYNQTKPSLKVVEKNEKTLQINDQK